MKIASPKLLLFSLLLGACFTFSPALDARAQTCTSSNTPPVERAGWRKATNIQVYIDPAIIGTRRDAVVQAFTNWGDASGSNGNNSAVSYTIVNSPPPSGTGFTVTSTSPVANPGLRAETRNYIDQDGYTTHAETLLDPQVTDPAAVLEVMAHEIGHPVGLGDCASCGTSSVMGPGPTPGNYNQIMGRPTSPSQCDNQKLQQANYPPCNPPVNLSDCLNYDVNTCTCREYAGGGGGGGVGGEGGGGYYDYCTPYYWCYYESYDGGETWYLMDMEYAGCW